MGAVHGKDHGGSAVTAPAQPRALTREEIEVIARVCHGTNIELQKAHGDEAPSLPWEAESDETRQVAVAGVERALAGITPEELHAAWCRDLAADGWRRGGVKDRLAKTHPCLVPYGQLPPEQKVKDAVFLAVVKAMSGGGAPQSAVPGQAAHAGAVSHLGISGKQAAELWKQQSERDVAYWTAIEEGVLAAREPHAADGTHVKPDLITVDYLKGETTVSWDYREQPPMEDIAEIIAQMTGGALRMTMPETGSDEYELVISHAEYGQPQPAPEPGLPS
jgi:hypothetical protein